MSEIVIEGDGKFPMDVRVPIAAVRFAEDGTANITIRGSYRKRSVGAEVAIRARMKPGIVGTEVDETAFYEKGAIIRSLGDATRHLADVLAEIYIISIGNAAPLDQLDLTCIALGGDPMLIKTEHLNFKVFHDDEDKIKLYFEMFLHVDIPSGYVRFDEKDEEYRDNVVRSFAALRPPSSY
jgi:hypothetical protein